MLDSVHFNNYTNKPSVYHEGNFIVRNYTEDQAGMDIRKEDVVQARNGWYYTPEIYGKGHDVAKADTRHRPGVLVREADAVPPLNELYHRLNGERNGDYWSEDEDFWDIAFHMQDLLK